MTTALLTFFNCSSIPPFNNLMVAGAHRLVMTRVSVKGVPFPRINVSSNPTVCASVSGSAASAEAGDRNEISSKNRSIFSVWNSKVYERLNCQSGMPWRVINMTKSFAINWPDLFLKFMAFPPVFHCLAWWQELFFIFQIVKNKSNELICQKIGWSV